MPDGWSSRDVGAVAAAGRAAYADAVFTVSGSGADVWGTADELGFAYRAMTGDGTIVARVASVDNVDPWTKVGVIMTLLTGIIVVSAVLVILVNLLVDITYAILDPRVGATEAAA